MKPLVGITAGEVENPNAWAPMMYGQNHTYSDAIVRSGGAPCLIPITSNTDSLRSIYENLKGIVFSGGNDINPALYGETAGSHIKHISLNRDKTEKQLMEWALEDGKPILAICRGMQLLNVVCGGTLHQDIPTELSNTADHTASTRHKNTEYIVHNLKLEPDSRLSQLLGASVIAANSNHHQGVKNLAPNLRAVAWAEDGVVEAIEADGDNYVIGIQCHPEALDAQVVPGWRRLFKSFVEACISEAMVYQTQQIIRLVEEDLV